MTDLPDIKIKALVSFPSSAIGGTGIEVAKVDGNFVVDLAYEDFAPPTGGVSDPTHQNVLLWNNTTSAYTLTPISLFGGGGGIPEAPNDGTQYGRQSASWTPVVAGSTVLPATAVPLIESGSGQVGASAKYAREDHVHPAAGGSGDVTGPAGAVADNIATYNGTTGKIIKDGGSKISDLAPLASPAFTGTPTAPTATAGNSSIAIATTAFVTSVDITKVAKVVARVFTSSTTYTPTAGILYAIIECFGAGAAGGGTISVSGNYIFGGGGAGGNYARKIATASAIGASQSVTIGAGGAGVSGAVGGNGGATSVGAICSANGGNGGGFCQPGVSVPGAAQPSTTAGVGDLTIIGGAGAPAFSSTVFNFVHGGGTGALGSSGGSVTYNGNGSAANGFGGGGGGSSNDNSGTGTTRTGGNGGSGFVIITEFCS